MSEYGTYKTVTASLWYVKQSRPASGLGFQLKIIKIIKGVPFSLGHGLPRQLARRSSAHVRAPKEARDRSSLIIARGTDNDNRERN